MELTGGHAVPAVVASANGVVHFDVRVDPEAVLGSVPIGLAAGAREAVVGISHRRHFNNCGLLLHRRFLNLMVKSLPQFNIDLAQADGARMARLPESRLGQISDELCVRNLAATGEPENVNVAADLGVFICVGDGYGTGNRRMLLGGLASLVAAANNIS